MAPIPYNTNKKKGYNLDNNITPLKVNRRRDNRLFIGSNAFFQDKLDDKQLLLSEFADISYKKPDERPKEYKGYKYDAELSNRDTAVYAPIDTSKEFKPAIVSYRGTDISQFNKRAIQDITQDALIATGLAGITKNINPRYIEAKKTFDKTTEKYGRTEITGHSLGSRVGYETALSLNTRGKKSLDKATLFSLPFGLPIRPVGALTAVNLPASVFPYALLPLVLGPSAVANPLTYLKGSESLQEQKYREGKDQTKIFEKIEAIGGQFDTIGSFIGPGRIKSTKLIQPKHTILSPYNPFNTATLHELQGKYKIDKDLKEKDKIKDEL